MYIYFHIFIFLQSVQKDFSNLTASLESERYRSESLEEQINDLTELHQVNLSILSQAFSIDLSTTNL